MNDFYINIITTIITTVLGFLFGIANTKHLSNRKNYEEQLNRVFSPLYKELSTFGIDCKETKELVEKLFRIAYENHQYVPSELMDNIISLKDRTLANESIMLHQTSEFKFICNYVAHTYLKLQQRLRKNQNIIEYGLKRYSAIANKLNDFCMVINFIVLSVTLPNIYYNFFDPYIALYILIVNTTLLFVAIYLNYYILEKEKEESELKRRWTK